MINLRNANSSMRLFADSPILVNAAKDGDGCGLPNPKDILSEFHDGFFRKVSSSRSIALHRTLSGTLEFANNQRPLRSLPVHSVTIWPKHCLGNLLCATNTMPLDLLKDLAYLEDILASGTLSDHSHDCLKQSFKVQMVLGYTCARKAISYSRTKSSTSDLFSLLATVTQTRGTSKQFNDCPQQKKPYISNFLD